MLTIATILIFLGLIGLYIRGGRVSGYTFDLDYDSHYSTLRNHIWIPRFHNRDTPLRFTVWMHNSCLYEIHGSDRDDINKLYGYSEGDHRQNSIRIGWRGIDNFIEYFVYWTIDGIDYSKSLGRFDPEELHTFDIRQTKDLYIVRFNGVDRLVPRGQNIKHGWFSYILRPYFGGNQTAPKNMYIEINEL